MTNTRLNSQVWMIYILLVLSYFFSYFFRVSTSVVLPQLQLEWGLSAALVGFISSMYYYTYALMQPLSGVLNDKVGPTRTVGFGLVVTSIGSFIFGLGDSVTSLVCGRLLMGIGLSPMLSGLLVFQGVNFKPEQYAFFSGLSMMIGNFGSVVSVGPLSLALHHWGRGSIFSVLSIIAICVAILLFLSRTPKSKEEKSMSFFAIFKLRFWAAFKVIRTSRELQKIIAIWMICFGALMALQGLWAVSWFSSVFPEHAQHASTAASFIGVGVMIGNFLGGWTCKQPGKRSRYITICVYCIAFCWMLLICCFAFSVGFVTTTIVAGILGLANGIGFTQFTAAVNEIAPIGRGGSVFGITNCFTFSCVILFQWGTGVIIGNLNTHMFPSSAFLVTFGIVMGCMIIPIVAVSLLKPIKRVA